MDESKTERAVIRPYFYAIRIFTEGISLECLAAVVEAGAGTFAAFPRSAKTQKHNSSSIETYLTFLTPLPTWIPSDMLPGY
jgi:hypothetical protein